MLTSDYFTKLIISESNLQNFEKFIERIAKEKIYTFYIVLSIILYNLCKTSTNINIKEYIELLKINQLPISSSGINSYIDFLCRANYLEICQSFFGDMISYKPLLEIPRTNSINQIKESNNENINEENWYKYNFLWNIFEIFM